MLTHVDQKSNMPTMVDVTTKPIRHRVARAQSSVQLPDQFRELADRGELILKKGPVFQTAIIAGTMAAKKTHEMIPFCHQIPIESCKIKISMSDDLLVKIDCEVKTTARTGIEMEALFGATTAALTIYDMCKAISHDILIQDTKLVMKTGGKRTVLDRPVYGLVLTGGKSKRMQEDKALLNYRGMPHAEYVFRILENYCEEVFLSARPGQWQGTALEELPTIEDGKSDLGPIAGILSAFEKFPDGNWIVVACDLINFNSEAVDGLLSNFDSSAIATAYTNADKGFPEPLCALYTPPARGVFAKAVASGRTCPVSVLSSVRTHTISQLGRVDLTNVNTQAERMEIKNENS
jgi:cyclic pyranopterin phosphate synthase